MGFGFDLERGTHTGNGSDRQVCRQAKAFPHLMVTGMLDLDFVGGMDLACHLSNEGAGVGKGEQGRIKCRALWWCWGQFAGHGAYSLHTESVSHMMLTRNALAEARESVSSTAAEAAWLPRPEGQVL